MRIERRDRTVRACRGAEAKAIRADAMERVLVVLDKTPDDVAAHKLMPVIEETADKEMIDLLCHKGT